MFLDENGQASVEFLFITLVVLIIIGGFVSLISNEQGQTSTGNIAQARITGEMVAETINTVYTNGAGYSVNLTVPNNMTLVINNPPGYVTVNSVFWNGLQYTNLQNVSVKFIPWNIQNGTLNTDTTYTVTNNGSSGIIFTPHPS
jgi:uncharacterized protein (UPF0333 family)